MWYVVQTLSGREGRVCDLMERLVDSELLEECFVLRYETVKKIRGEWRTCTAVLFPGYVIVVTNHVEQLEQALRKVPQFTRILGNDRMFMPLERDEMAWLSAFTERKRRVIGMSSGVIEGDEIVILEGPLMNRTGWIRKIDRRKRVAYLEMRMFGRTLQTKVGLGIVRKTPKRE